MILGIDTGLRTGWAVWDDTLIESGVQDFSKQRGESNGAIFLRFRNWLNKMLVDNQIHFVAYEQSHHRGGASTEVGINLTGRIQECCAAHDIEYVPVHTATLKKFATGDGRASKEDMMKVAKEILGREPIDDNESDAIILAKFGYENYG